VAETVTVDLRKLQGLHVIGRDQIARAVEADGIPNDDDAVATLGRRLSLRARLDERPPLPDVTTTFGAASHVAP
jgi:hypothetical protein